MIPYDELNEYTRRRVLTEAAKLTVTHFAETTRSKPHDSVFVAMHMIGRGVRTKFEWNADAQSCYTVGGADWVRTYAVSAGISYLSRYRPSEQLSQRNRNVRRQFDTVEVPMADVVEFIQNLCRRATGEAES